MLTNRVLDRLIVDPAQPVLGEGQAPRELDGRGESVGTRADDDGVVHGAQRSP
jgi:hypothetical protein